MDVFFIIVLFFVTPFFYLLYIFIKEVSLKKSLFMKKSQLGLSLIESAMVLALAAAVTSGVLYYYYSSKENNAILETTKGIQSIIAATQSLYGSRGHTAGNIDAYAISAVSGIEVGKPKIATGVTGGNGDVYYLPGKIAEAQYFPMSNSNSSRTLLTIHTASKSACMALSVLRLGTMVDGNPRVVVGANDQMGQDAFNAATEVASPSEASSVCQNTNDTKRAHIMYSLKIQ